MPDGGFVVCGPLTALLAAGGSGPMLVLSGEADATSVGPLSELISAELSRGTKLLTVDVSGLRFMDSATIRALVRAARTLRERGGNLVLLYPQPPVARVLALICADQMFTIRGGSYGEPEPESEAG